MENVSLINFDKEVERQLDKIFPENNFNMITKRSRKNDHAFYPLNKLKKIVLNLEWEVGGGPHSLDSLSIELSSESAY